MTSGQRGFTLVEVMVAMAIGTVIILGAGQLFLTTFQTFRAVDAVSRKQEALVFAVNTLTQAARKGNIANYAITSDERRTDGGARHYCVLQDEHQSQPLIDLAQVDRAADCPPLYEANADDVSYSVTLLIGDCRESANATCDQFTLTMSEREKIAALLEARS
ncbi:prepilin-type N-terminal cleavage/methylation domain-containing protein [Halomonas sp. MC140]|nr:prepilin-type N-terminal cleavage/methylation domain-containing protein [Halomonas sp. MC140]MDN7131544.1 prepilin-type N-terminal cleavage/methylation domain-containing protein [Halomonas sp. MC140]